jgi:hypothetical protein
MIKHYELHGAGCKGCLKKITNTLIRLPEVTRIVSIDLHSITIGFVDSVLFVDLQILNSNFDGSFWLSQRPDIINFILLDEPIFAKNFL